ncbi:uncharacterized protein B0H18DRAFT_953420 [Fomitopsis serialis]|uniref:uncharacterized protein n=1 Tax=Fomitopsis serialis TaxID=139415 RepID=UPI002008DFC1|nr:uncharacterized protein B0H18DRAFT_953420 [Neoantrodia serialis]KAH9929681.1 hypothetical protein B0H18DRAFT_953420 [Neoantrodia serialis]
MLGQPPTTLGVDDDRTMHFAYANPPSEGSDPDTNVILRRIYGDELVTEDVSQLFINEKLDEKDSLLMEVPIMPPPNEHAPTAMFLPCQTTELLAPAKVKPGQPDDHAASLPSQSGYLKKVKGMQALTIELSWIPFKFGSSVPNDAAVTGVADSIENALTAELRQEDPGLVSQLTNLLEKTLRLEGFVDDEQSMPSTRKCLDDSSDSLDLGGQEAERRTQDSAGSYEDDEDLGSSDKENEEFMYPLPEEEEGPPPKRARTSDWERQFYVSELELEAPTNDSGVFLSSSAAMSNNDIGGFAGMAYAAEGYEGPHTDGDLFLDIDPVHELGWEHWSAPVPGTWDEYLAIPAVLGAL